MIPRLLVPEKLSPVSATPTDGHRRAWTILDDRQLIQADIPLKPLEAESKIPLHMPLEVLGGRILIPREAEPGTLELPAPGEHVLPTDADERMAVPVDARPKELVAETFLPIEVLEQEDLVTADVFTTGLVKLMPKQVSEPPKEISRLMILGYSTSVALNLLVIVAMILVAIFSPHREPTEAELEAASRELGIVYLPNSMFNQPKSAPKSVEPSDKLRVDPGLLKKLVPDVLPTPAPGPVSPPQVVAPRPPQELPSAPVPQTQNPVPMPRVQAPPHFDAPPPAPDAPTPAFKLPSASPGRAIEDAVTGAAGRGQTPPVSFGGAMPRGGGGGLSGGGGGGGGYLGGGVQMLTPDQGVDFSSYLNRLVDRVRREWYSVMPESARMGDRGRVVIDFKVLRDGSVPLPEPLLRSTSGKEQLDRAALASIRGASPFEQLPPAFSGQYIELRFIFFYNYRPEEIQ
ncbi:MAG TPA: TonB family protein [Candidatus Acidoferrales bacterium]|nr:TonB family protein [Candidatus Acidoferrales bacterium]